MRVLALGSHSTGSLCVNSFCDLWYASWIGILQCIGCYVTFVTLWNGFFCHMFTNSTYAVILVDWYPTSTSCRYFTNSTYAVILVDWYPTDISCIKFLLRQKVDWYPTLYGTVCSYCITVIFVYINRYIYGYLVSMLPRWWLGCM